MSFSRPLILAAALAGSAPALAQSFPGQMVQTVPRATPDADALADAMRRIGANPRDLNSLITAGELSLKLGDVNAAASLFKRAENVDPMNGRVKAGMARILVTQQRPGEALRYFDQAVGYGLSATTFAGDRGLAYDLIGEQERAQRDYRVALKAADDEEIQRRYALSLGISGRRKEALDVIDAQLRRNDRSAWRVRAFVLAMTGDVPGAQKIASTMMPQGMGAALSPFFTRLEALPPIDRAFAVHFGELRATPQRLADARMAPALPPLAPEPRPAVQLAAATPAAAPAKPMDARTKRRLAREEAKRARELAMAQQRQRAADARAARSRPTRTTAPAVALASAQQAGSAPQSAETLQPPRYAGVEFAASKPVVQALASPPPAAVASRQPTPAAPYTPTPQPAWTPSAVPPARTPQPAWKPSTVPPARAQVAAAPTPAWQPARTAPSTSSAAGASTSSVPAPTRFVTTAPAPASPPPAYAATARSPVSSPPTGTISTAPSAAPSSYAATTRAPVTSPSTTTALSTAAAPGAPSAAVAPTPTRPAVSEDTILARIMAGITIPGEELGVAPIRPPEPPRPAVSASVGTTAPDPLPARVDTPAPKPTPTTSSSPASAKATVASPKPDVKPTPAAKEKKTPAPDPKKLAAERKAAAAKKLADAKKAEETKKAAEEAKAAKADPARTWVQVAGGANKDDLPKAWAAAQKKADALKGKTAYTTPLRFTNRVVTGPFKTDAEAREFVNTLAKQGISAFTFTSEKGQKMTRLPAK
ncbi:MAG: hypothetical protein K0S66_1884 [Sphingomonas sp.]|jgi:tetratricopeptide (TPR) repeat protein|nr:hypothetical protein [Sphingomonas sp.]